MSVPSQRPDTMAHLPHFHSGSYRDLLGTAESIVEMDEQIRHVEALVGDITMKCNTRLLDKSLANLRSLEEHVRVAGLEYRFGRLRWRI